MNIDGYLSQLANFYPYQTTVTTTHKNYRSDLMCAVQEGLAVSAVSLYFILIIKVMVSTKWVEEEKSFLF